MKKLGIVVLVLLVLVPVLFVNRFWVLANLGALAGPPDLLPPQEEPGAVWFDDYFTIFKIDDRTYAIGETRYWQKNFNYLILGDEKALLVDAGPGIRDIRPVVRSLTDLPLTFVPSHLHFDHVGNGFEFANVAMIDVPYLRERAPDNKLQVIFEEHLGVMERIPEPLLTIGEWWPSGKILDLGGRQIRVVYTPGHTSDGITLLDVEAGYAFTGDFFISGGLAEFPPNGGMGDYLQGVELLIKHAPVSTRLFGAHRNLLLDEVETGIPEATMQDLFDTHTTLLKIRDGKQKGRGPYPVIYEINDVMQIWTNPVFMHDWTPRNPVAD